MLALIFAPFYILINGYLLFWVLRWTGACHRLCASGGFRAVLCVLYAFTALTPLTGFLIRKPLAVHRLLKRIGNDWLGWMAYLVLAVLTVELLLFLVRRIRGKDFAQMQRVRRIQGGAALAMVCAVSVYGTVHAFSPRVAEYEVSVPGKGEDMSIALLSDLHLGYNTDPSYIEQMAQMVNGMQVDLVAVAGDIFDNEYEAIPEPERVAAALASMESTDGTYACWGNHDVAEAILAGFTWDTQDRRKDDPRFRRFLAASDMTLLEDEMTVLDNGVQLIGRLDPSRDRKLGEKRLTPAEWARRIDPEQPVFVLDHQPKELEALSAAGVDLDLSGHTHDGQIFPANWIMPLLWENPHGCVQVGEMESVVTAGWGVWGPAMRVGTDSEIVHITVHFTEK